MHNSLQLWTQEHSVYKKHLDDVLSLFPASNSGQFTETMFFPIRKAYQLKMLSNQPVFHYMLPSYLQVDERNSLLWCLPL